MHPLEHEPPGCRVEAHTRALVGREQGIDAGAGRLEGGDPGGECMRNVVKGRPEHMFRMNAR